MARDLGASEADIKRVLDTHDAGAEDWDAGQWLQAFLMYAVPRRAAQRAEEARKREAKAKASRTTSKRAQQKAIATRHDTTKGQKLVDERVERVEREAEALAEKINPKKRRKPKEAG